MVELKFKDIESLNAVTGALHKNGYKYSTFIIWKKGDGGIDYFTVQIEGVEMASEKCDLIDRMVHGHWDDSGRYRFPSGKKAVRCNMCGCALSEGEYKYHYFNWNYCPACGAKMDGDGNG